MTSLVYRRTSLKALRLCLLLSQSQQPTAHPKPLDVGVDRHVVQQQMVLS